MVGETVRRGVFLALGVSLPVRLLATGRCSGAASGVPQSPQNLAAGLTPAPQLGQVRTSAAPHSSQNFFPSGFSNLQLGQCMALVYCIRHDWARKKLCLLPSLLSDPATTQRRTCATASARSLCPVLLPLLQRPLLSSQGQRIKSALLRAPVLSTHYPIRRASGGWGHRPFPRAGV
jgi:hypothetical protein